MNSIAKDFLFNRSLSNFSKTILPAFILTLSILSGQSSFAISSAFKNSIFSSDKSSLAKVLLPLPFAQAIINKIGLSINIF